MIKYRYEYCGNAEYVELHLNAKLTDSEYAVGSGINDGETEQDKFRLGLFKSCPGVTDTVRIKSYSITVTRGIAFERDEVLNSLLEICKMIFIDQEFTQLPTLRNDINGVQCKDCLDAQREEMQACMRDMDTLDY